MFLNGCDLVCKNKFSSECFEKMWKNVQFDKISDQIDWLNSTLSNMAQDETIIWKVVVVHWAIFSAGENHGDNEALKEAILPLLIEYKVDVVLSGHDHSVQYLRMDLDVHDRLQDAAGEKKWSMSDESDSILEAVTVETETTITNNNTNSSVNATSENSLNNSQSDTINSTGMNSTTEDITGDNTTSAMVNTTSAPAPEQKKKEACPNEVDYSYCSAHEYFHNELTKCGIKQKHHQSISLSQIVPRTSMHDIDLHEIKFSRASATSQHEYLHQFVIGNGGSELEKLCALRHRRSHGRLRYGNSVLGIGDVRITETKLQVRLLSETDEVLYSVNIFKDE